MTDPIEIRVPTEVERGVIDRIHSIVFAWTQRPEELDRRRDVLDLDRFRIAVDPAIGTGGDSVIGVAGSYAFDLTLPGGATVPIGGVTGVGVLPTHRRRGILRRLMDAVHEDVAGRGEPVMALYASEGAIYDRFGYGVAARARKVEIDRRRAVWRPWVDEMAEGDGPVVVLAGDDPVPRLASRWDAYRTTRPGELSRSEAWWRYLLAGQGEGLLRAVHADGYAVWKVTPHWNDGHPAHTLHVEELAAGTPAAHRALWRTVLGVDLVGTVTCWDVTLDDPLPQLLTDTRVVRTRELNDGLWVRVDDMATAFGARTYGTDDELVVEVEGARWRIGAGECRRVRRRADLVGDRGAVSALLLGGVRPSELIAGRRIEARTSEIARRADAMFVSGPLPHCQTGF